jgi:hypothetical protein
MVGVATDKRLATYILSLPEQVVMSSIPSALNPMTAVQAIWRFFYVLAQYLVHAIFKAPAPKSPGQLPNPYGRVAVIGAGIFLLFTIKPAYS